MNRKYTEEELSKLFFKALDLFNSRLDSDISRDNTIIAFFHVQNGLEVYETFCKDHFPEHMQENYREKDYFESFAAQAFVSDVEYGVLIRSDISYSSDGVRYMFLHEISHLYCTRNEVEGGHFFNRFCMGSGAEDGMLNAGYAIWREAIADIMADSVLSDYTMCTLSDLAVEVADLYRLITVTEADSKKYVSRILSDIMIAGEVAGTEQWSEAETAIARCLTIPDCQLMLLIRMVFENLHKPPFWTITPEFIKELGEVYISMLAHKQLRAEILKD